MAALKQELDRLNDYFSDSLSAGKDAYAVLADIVDGEIRHPEMAFLYGYVYEGDMPPLWDANLPCGETYGSWTAKHVYSYPVER